MTHAGATIERPAGSHRVGGIALERLAERVGSTPFFAYDRALLTERVELLRATLPGEIDLSYAVKANPMPAVVQHLSGLVDSFDVASGAELRRRLPLYMVPKEIVVRPEIPRSPNGKFDRNLLRLEITS